jgi:hypothetical protein
MELHGNGARLTLHFGAKNAAYLLYIHNILASFGYLSPTVPTVKPRPSGRKNTKKIAISILQSN